MPGRRKHDNSGSARNHRKMRSGRKSHQKGQLGRSKRLRGRTPQTKGVGPYGT